MVLISGFEPPRGCGAGESQMDRRDSAKIQSFGGCMHRVCIWRVETWVPGTSIQPRSLNPAESIFIGICVSVIS